jgi:aryl-alcohol dehydrogenase-like predicted oxidoreductase
MQYVRLGNTGLIVSRIALGTATFGTNPPDRLKGFWGKVDQDAANQLVGEAIDSGVNFFNTSDEYGHGQSETVLGEALRTRRSEVILTSKVGNRVGEGVMDQGLSRRHIIQAVDDSLRRLNTDYLDLYIAHRYDPSTPLEESLESFDSLVRSGKVRYVGFSNWPAWMAAKALGIQDRKGFTSFCNSEMYYSLLCRDIEDEFVPFSIDANIGLTVWSPLSMGLLSGRYTSPDPKGDGRLTNYVPLIPLDREFAYRIVEVLKVIADDHHSSVAQIAIAWLLSKRHVSSVIVGVSSSAQLADNVGALEIRLTADQLSDLDTFTQPPARYPSWLTPKDRVFEALELRRL